MVKPEVSVDIGTITAVNSNVDEGILRDIFRGNISAHAEALAGLTATSITIPDITVSFATKKDGASKGGKVSFSNIVLDNVVDGVAGSVTLGGVDLSSTEDVSGRFGAISAKTVNIGGMLGIYGLVAAANTTELATIYSDFTAVGGEVKAEDTTCKFGPMEAAEFKGRPLKYSLAEILAMSQSMETEGDSPSPETIGLALRMYADIFTAFESSPVTFGGFDCTGTDSNNGPMAFSIAGITMGGMAPGIYPAIAMQGLKIAVEGDGALSVGNVAVKSMDLSGPIAAVEAAPAAIDQAWLEANARSLVPAFGGFSFDNVAMDLPSPDAPDERIKATVGAFDLSLDNYRNGIPTKLSATANNIVVDLPQDSGDEQLEQLIDLGITKVDFGFAVKTAWDEAANAINIEEVSIDGANLASVALAGTIGNATAALFDIDPDNALSAAMGIVIQNLKVDVTDAGLTDLILAGVAADQGTNAATMRPIFAGLAEGTILGMLAGAAEAQNVGKAVSTFIRGEAKNLVIDMTAKDPAGLGLMDFLAAEDDPTVLIGKTNITATAK